MGNWWTNRAHLLDDGVPTVFVAAWNATDMEKRCADVVCAGRDDQVTINEALARVGRRRQLYVAGHTRGRVVSSGAGGRPSPSRTGATPSGLVCV